MTINFQFLGNLIFFLLLPRGHLILILSLSLTLKCCAGWSVAHNRKKREIHRSSSIVCCCFFLPSQNQPIMCWLCARYPPDWNNISRNKPKKNEMMRPLVDRRLSKDIMSGPAESRRERGSYKWNENQQKKSWVDCALRRDPEVTKWYVIKFCF